MNLNKNKNKIPQIAFYPTREENDAFERIRKHHGQRKKSDVLVFLITQEDKKISNKFCSLGGISKDITGGELNITIKQ